MPALLLACRLAEQQRGDDAEVVHDGGPRLRDLAPPRLRMEAVGLDLAVAGQDGAEQRHDAGVDVIERQRIVDAVLPLAQRCHAAERGIPGSGRHLVAMREDAALRPPGRARRVEDAGRRLRRWLSAGGWPRRFRQRSRKMLRQRHRRLVRALRQGLAHLCLAGAERQHEIGLAVLQEVGRLARPVVRIDGHAAGADAVQRQRVQDVLGAVLQQRRHAMPEAIARARVSRRQLVDARPRLRVRQLEALRQVAALVVGRDGQEWTVGMDLTAAANTAPMVVSSLISATYFSRAPGVTLDRFLDIADVGRASYRTPYAAQASRLYGGGARCQRQHPHPRRCREPGGGHRPDDRRPEAAAGVIASLAIYGFGLIAVFACSAAYNLATEARLKAILRRFDHAAIYVKIASTYTPFAMVRWATRRLCVAGGGVAIAAFGATAKLLWPGRLVRTSYVLYLRRLGHRRRLRSVRLGGLGPRAAPAGGRRHPLYPRRDLPPMGAAALHTAVWHALVVAASACHFAAIVDAVGLRPP